MTVCERVEAEKKWVVCSRYLEWVSYPFSSGSSRPRNQTRISYIAGGFFTSWATREAQCINTGSYSIPRIKVSGNRNIYKKVIWGP